LGELMPVRSGGITPVSRVRTCELTSSRPKTTILSLVVTFGRHLGYGRAQIDDFLSFVLRLFRNGERHRAGEFPVHCFDWQRGGIVGGHDREKPRHVRFIARQVVLRSNRFLLKDEAVNLTY
jgi:hypothetical protein